MPEIDTLELRVGDPLAQQRFYRDVIGMRNLDRGRIGYDDEEMGIRFLPAQSPYAPGPADLYWKIAIAVPDLGLACNQLVAAGVSVAPPRQFRDVGYLTNFKDPEGFSIELIQHVFEGDVSPCPVDPSRLGGGPCLNLLTLRCHDIDPINRFCLDQLGMRTLSVQPVNPYGFTLYFYAFTDEEPPDADLKAIANRSWTYQRPYTVLEVQHLHDAQAVTGTDAKAAGYGRTVITGKSFSSNNALGLSASVDGPSGSETSDF